jgi:two-component system, NtrC family, nitrogen regulation sensor histidine kinase NtrY
MNLRTRLATTAAWILFAGLLLMLGTSVEIDIVEFLQGLKENSSFVPMAVFFSTVNLNVILLFVLVFLVFRNGVKLVVDRRRHLLGSSLRTKMVTSFLFFSLLPTVILLYVSTKFVNANLDRWLPADLVQTTENSLNTERGYRDKLARVLKESLPHLKPESVDFVYNLFRPVFFLSLT